MENIESTKQKFHQKTWFTWIALIFFAPVGIFLLWRNKHHNKVVRVIVTAVFALIFIATVTTDSEESASSPSSSEPALATVEDEDEIDEEVEIDEVTAAVEEEEIEEVETREQIHLTVDELRKNWNNIAEGIEGLESLVIVDFQTLDTADENEGFGFTIDNGLSLQGINYEDGTIKEVYVHSEWDTFKEDRFFDLMAWGLLIGALEPSLTDDERGVILTNELNLDEKMSFLQEEQLYRTENYTLKLAFYEQMDIIRLSVFDPNKD
ncbi:hypothetical protein [Halalkalibacter flavus]|uniref:hypothetical protein n=1 Tax=Halalkalibacter flavus TaxID=3090668 RepID=UPI002FC61C56